MDMANPKKSLVVGLALVVVLVIAGILAQRWLAGSGSGNALMIIKPYRYAGTWVFDDANVGLSREPFVAGIPEMIDDMVKDIPDAENGFRLLFSAQPFPGHTHKLVWRRGDDNGNWYYCEQFDKEGWLCPGLFRYYKEPPPEIYAKAEKL
jgi:hypothetical protein